MYKIIYCMDNGYHYFGKTTIMVPPQNSFGPTIWRLTNSGKYALVFANLSLTKCIAAFIEMEAKGILETNDDAFIRDDLSRFDKRQVPLYVDIAIKALNNDPMAIDLINEGVIR